MPAGFNLRVDIWRISTDDEDDRVGGAMITGTIQYHNVMARMEQEPASQLLEQQGLETVHVYKMNVIPGTMQIYERDEVQVVQPKDHHYFNQRFRVRGVIYSSHNPRDPRNYIMLSMNRSDRMHRQQ